MHTEAKVIRKNEGVKLVDRLTIDGHDWRVFWPRRIPGSLFPETADKKILGLCLHEARHFEFSRAQSRFELLDTVIHEISHAVFPDYKEEAITRFADTLATALDDLGLRFVHGLELRKPTPKKSRK